MRENENESENESNNLSASAGRNESIIESASAGGCEIEMTGLPWPKTWKGAYLLVIGSLILWLLLLIALTESFA